MDEGERREIGQDFILFFLWVEFLFIKSRYLHVRIQRDANYSKIEKYFSMC